MPGIEWETCSHVYQLSMSVGQYRALASHAKIGLFADSLKDEPIDDLKIPVNHDLKK
jgi:hypothetical protein